MSFLANFGQMFAQGYEYETYSEPYYDTTMPTTQVDEGTAVAVFMGMMLFIIIGAIIGYVINAFLLSRIFKKAGVEEWKAWVPIYNTWIMYELGDQKGWWAVLMLVPVVNFVALVFFFIAAYNIGLKLGKEGVFVLLAIFLPIVWLAWLGFDKSTWKGKVPATTATSATTSPASAEETAAKTEEKPPVPPQTPDAK